MSDISGVFFNRDHMTSSRMNSTHNMMVVEICDKVRMQEII